MIATIQDCYGHCTCTHNSTTCDCTDAYAYSDSTVESHNVYTATKTLEEAYYEEIKREREEAEEFFWLELEKQIWGINSYFFNLKEKVKISLSKYFFKNKVKVNMNNRRRFHSRQNIGIMNFRAI